MSLSDTELVMLIGARKLESRETGAFTLDALITECSKYNICILHWWLLMIYTQIRAKDVGCGSRQLTGVAVIGMGDRRIPICAEGIPSHAYYCCCLCTDL